MILEEVVHDYLISHGYTYTHHPEILEETEGPTFFLPSHDEYESSEEQIYVSETGIMEIFRF